MTKATTLLLNGKLYECRPGETVLEALLRQHVSVPYSCKKQICMSCMMQSLNCEPPNKSQLNLKETLQMQNNFLACACIPECDMEISLNQERLTTQVAARVVEINRLNSSMLELVLQCETPVDFNGGQSALLLNYEHIGKKFPIASPSSAKTTGRMEVHVERIRGGAFSEWLFNHLNVGDQLYVCGITGWDAGLTPLIGMVQDIFEQAHLGPVYLFHSVEAAEYIYFEKALWEIGDYFPNFHYLPCVRQGAAPLGGYSGKIEKIIAHVLADLSGWKVFLCGKKDQTHAVQRYVYLAGARMKDIYLEVTSI
ncbi:MAG: 2Fe-2S iron-sulfur cluster-binding protein [Gammaproteobacteria bacterium]